MHTPFAIHEDLLYDLMECRHQEMNKKLKAARETVTLHSSSVRNETNSIYKLFKNGHFAPM